MNVILVLNGLNKFMEWQGKPYILSRRKFLRKNTLWSISHIPRSCNFVAHNLAQWAKSSQLFGNVNLTTLPPSVFCNRGGTLDLCTDSADPLNDIA